MNLDFLKYFTAVVECQSISQAAEQCFLSRQSLSKAIHHAEKELDVALISYHDRKLEITEEGRLLYQSAKEILRIWEKTQLDLDQRKNIQVTLRIGFGRMSCFLWDEAHIEEFQRQAPKIEIHKETAVSDQLLSMLREGEIDAIVSNLVPNDPRYQSEPILKRPIYAAVHRSDPLSAKSVITPVDLKDKTNLFIADDKIGAAYFLSMMAKFNFSPKIVFCQDSSLTSVFSAIAAVQGVFLTSAIFNTLISPTECTFIPFHTGLPYRDYNMDIHFTYARNPRHLSALTLYKNYLMDHVKEIYFEK